VYNNKISGNDSKKIGISLKKIPFLTKPSMRLWQRNDPEWYPSQNWSHNRFSFRWFAFWMTCGWLNKIIDCIIFQNLYRHTVPTCGRVLSTMMVHIIDENLIKSTNFSTCVKQWAPWFFSLNSFSWTFRLYKLLYFNHNNLKKCYIGRNVCYMILSFCRLIGVKKEEKLSMHT